MSNTNEIIQDIKDQQFSNNKQLLLQEFYKKAKTKRHITQFGNYASSFPNIINIIG